MIDKQIYSSWAFSENEKEKGVMNHQIYNELKEKYRVYRNGAKKELVDGVDCDFSEYDVVIGREPKYHHALYRIHKNAPELTTLELALLCDGGNLCFGHSMHGTQIYVFED